MTAPTMKVCGTCVAVAAVKEDYEMMSDLLRASTTGIELLFVPLRPLADLALLSPSRSHKDLLLDFLRSHECSQHPCSDQIRVPKADRLAPRGGAYWIMSLGDFLRYLPSTQLLLALLRDAAVKPSELFVQWAPADLTIKRPAQQSFLLLVSERNLLDVVFTTESDELLGTLLAYHPELIRAREDGWIIQANPVPSILGLRQRARGWYRGHRHFEELLEYGLDVNHPGVEESTLLSVLFDNSDNQFEIDIALLEHLRLLIRNGLMNFNMKHRSLFFAIISCCPFFNSSPDSQTSVLSTLILVETLGYQFRVPPPHEASWATLLFHKHRGLLTSQTRTQLWSDHVARLRNTPLTLSEIARNSVRCSIGGVRFQSKVNTLPVPNSLKEFIIAQVGFE